MARCNIAATNLSSCANTLLESTSVSRTPDNTESDSTLDRHIEELLANGEATDFGARTQERRHKARISEPFPARIWGIDSSDLPFNVDSVVDNISSSGVYLKTPRAVDIGSKVKLIVHFLSGPTSGVTASLQGRVLRSESQDDGKYGLAMAVSKHRFL